MGSLWGQGQLSLQRKSRVAKSIQRNLVSNCPLPRQMLIELNTWLFIRSGITWEGLGSAALLEEVYHQGSVLRFQKHKPGQATLSLLLREYKEHQVCQYATMFPAVTTAYTSKTISKPQWNAFLHKAALVIMSLHGERTLTVTQHKLIHLEVSVVLPR